MNRGCFLHNSVSNYVFGLLSLSFISAPKKRLGSGFNHLSIIPIVKRAAIAAVVCITSDLINLVSAASYVGPNGSILNLFHTYITFLAYTVNLLVNLITTILSFANWRDKMFPFGPKLKPLHQAPVRNQIEETRIRLLVKPVEKT